MSFNITMNFLGLDEVQKEIERLSTESELKALNKKIVKKAGKVGLEESEDKKESIQQKPYEIRATRQQNRAARGG